MGTSLSTENEMLLLQGHFPPLTLGRDSQQAAGCGVFLQAHHPRGQFGSMQAGGTGQRNSGGGCQVGGVAGGAAEWVLWAWWQTDWTGRAHNQGGKMAGITTREGSLVRCRQVGGDRGTLGGCQVGGAAGGAAEWVLWAWWQKD